MDVKEKALALHREWQGKIEVVARCPVTNSEELSLAYTPGVAEPCVAIEKDPSLSYTLTRRGHLIAVVTDGTAVLGLGDIGPEAAMPVMEGKAVLLKAFGDVDAVPICLDTKDVDEICRTVEILAPSFGGINLEDIGAPRCFEIERRLKEKLSIPVFHDDQHGTAIVVSAALLNAFKVAGKSFETATVVINGAGAAGIAIAKHLIGFHAKNVILCDKDGIIYQGAPNLTVAQEEMAKITNKDGLKGTLADALKGADVFIGVSRPNLVTAEMVSHMADRSIVFPMANPVPEIMPEEAKKGGAFIIGTGRSDYPNQVNNVLAFPGIFKGALDAGATDITEGMKLAASYAIASVLSEDEISVDRVLPDAFDPRVAKAVAEAVKNAAIQEGVIRK